MPTISLVFRVSMSDHHLLVGELHVILVILDKKKFIQPSCQHRNYLNFGRHKLLELVAISSLISNKNNLFPVILTRVA